jgi:hypothetical protein
VKCSLTCNRSCARDSRFSRISLFSCTYVVRNVTTAPRRLWRWSYGRYVGSPRVTRDLFSGDNYNIDTIGTFSQSFSGVSGFMATGLAGWRCRRWARLTC